MLKRNKFGFTLVEMMIALVISAFLFTAIISIFVSNLSHYRKVLNANKLNQQLIAVLDLMSNDIRRAGYWGNSATMIGSHLNNNPFQAGSNDITINGANNCILFTYDHDENGVLPTINTGTDDERYGFKLNNGAIQGRSSVGGFDCSSTNWENLTDTKVINITALVFTLSSSTVTTGPGTRGITIRTVNISVTGQLVSDASVSKTLTEQVRIRNDKFIP